MASSLACGNTMRAFGQRGYCSSGRLWNLGSQQLQTTRHKQLSLWQPQQQQPLQIRLAWYSSRHKSTNVARDTEKIVRVAAPKETAPVVTPREPTLLERFLGPKEMPERYTMAWYREVTLICTVFAITGTSTMMLVRPAVKNGLKIEGNFRDGPWSYRICSIVCMSPIYATLLVVVGTVFGRHAYFRHFSVKIFSRFGIPPELLDKNWKVHSQNFKKW